MRPARPVTPRRRARRSSWADQRHALVRVTCPFRSTAAAQRARFGWCLGLGVPEDGLPLVVRYLGPPGDYNSPYPVVYRMQDFGRQPVVGDWRGWPVWRDGSGGRVSWDSSVTLSVRDWRGGCQSGDYEIDFDSVAVGRFKSDASTDTFRCSGS